VRVRRKLPTPPITDHREVEEHVRKTVEKLRTQRAVRQGLGGAQNSDSDSAISTIGLQNLNAITAPVVSGRRRMAANFPVSERRTTGSLVILCRLPKACRRPKKIQWPTYLLTFHHTQPCKKPEVLLSRSDIISNTYGTRHVIRQSCFGINVHNKNC
jgi:hypothetical protein